MADELKRKISNLERATEIIDGSLFMASVPDSSAESGYTSKAATVDVIAERMLGGVRYETELETTAKDIFGAINEAAKSGGGGSGVDEFARAEISLVKADLSELKFSFDGILTNVGKYINVTTKKYASSGSHSASDLIKVYANVPINYALKATNSTAYVLAFYNENRISADTFIDGIVGVNASTVVSGTYTPTDDCYMVVSNITTYTDGYVYFNISVPTFLKKYVESQKGDAVVEANNYSDEQLGKHVPVLPKYWEAYIDSRINEISTGVEEVALNGDSFFFVTDIHLPSNAGRSPLIIENIKKKTGIHFTVCGGDILESHTNKQEALDVFRRWRELYDGYSIRGNHDNNTQGVASSIVDSVFLSDTEYYSLAQKRNELVVVNPDKKRYYYIDNEPQKIRYIFLDSGVPQTTNHPELASGWTAQLNWLDSKISELASGWTVVIFTHIFFAPSDKTVTVLPIDSTYGDRLISKIDALHDSANAKIACVITGHVHRDYSIVTEKGIPIIATTTDAYAQAQSYDNKWNHELGKTSEQAIDIFNIDTTNNVIKTIRIGAGNASANRTFTF